jgi:hypothetical protein
MGGGLMQLVAYGAQDIYLTGNPQMTFFKVVYRRHTNFSMECIQQTFKGKPAASSRVVATLARNGDLVHDCFLRVPGSAGVITGKGQNFGHNIINNIELEIGGQLIDKHYGHWMEAHAELTEKSPHNTGPSHAGQYAAGFFVSPELAHYRDIGPSNFQLTAFAGGQTSKNFNTATNGPNATTDVTQYPDFFVPLRFWFCRHVGLSLPLIALQYHEVNINIKFSKAAEEATVADPSLWCNYIYLDTDERRRFAQVSHEYLIEQVQLQEFTANANGDTLKLNFNHPVKELVWASTGLGHGGGDAGETDYPWGTKGVGLFTSFAPQGTATWQLKLNGHERFQKQSLTYFTRYQPYKYHTSMCKSVGTYQGHDTIGVYSFALKPEEHQPSGTCNFSRIDNAQLIYSSMSAKCKALFVYAVNYNVLRIMSGMGGLAYSN